MTRLAIRLLGSYHVSLDSFPITDFESNKERTLLAYLAVENSQAHTREKLAALFWPEASPKRAGSCLTQALYNLSLLVDDHMAQPPYLIRDRDTVQFNPQSAYWLDMQTFSAYLAAGRLSDQPQNEGVPGWCRQLQAAVALYRGDFLNGLESENSLQFDKWTLGIRQRLQCQALGALRLLVDYFTDCKEFDQALPYAWRMVALDPLGEPACRQLMSLLAASGQPSQALVQYERLQVMLAEELNAEPEPQTIALRDQIRADVSGSAPVILQMNNLPAGIPPLVGRRNELLELKELLMRPDCRLLTILAPGGSGKTRLAIELAHTCRTSFQHGICYVPLNPLQTPASILPAIVRALELARYDQHDLQTLLVNYLRDKHCLLVLDGFEHLLEGADRLLEILRYARRVKIVVTSRAGLNVAGERLYRLAGLRYPAGTAEDDEILDADAVRLLVAALQRAQPEFEPRSGDARRLLQICRQVQGMPLSILLVGAWGAEMTLAEISEQVRRDQDLFAYDWTDVHARQRSLQVTIDHTWNLLDERQQMAFQSLSVIRGDFSRQSARAISGALQQELDFLVERSLVQEVSPGWYTCLAPLREYGARKMAMAPRVAKLVGNRHSEHYLRKLVRLGKDLYGSRQAAALEMIDRECANYRAAWDWSARQGAAAQLAAAVDVLCQYYDLRLCYQDGESACRAASSGLIRHKAGSGSAELLGRIFTWQGCFSRLLGSYEDARMCMQAAQLQIEIAVIRDQVSRGRDRVLAGVGRPKSQTGSPELVIENYS